MNRLQGKYALITGASQGLGRQLAIDFAREGAAGIIPPQAISLGLHKQSPPAWAKNGASSYRNGINLTS
jgi:hypothetical protein